MQDSHMAKSKYIWIRPGPLSTYNMPIGNNGSSPDHNENIFDSLISFMLKYCPLDK